ncbi:MAG: hypothetical protein GY801_39040, partial [bacterium]|nr:hypothetical protein [bacterium]
MMSLTAEIQEYAHSQGAQLVGFAPVDVYTDYISEVERRFQETGAQPEHFMISPVTNRQRQVKSEAHSFFTRLSDVHATFPDAKTIIILGVYTYDEAAVYRHTHQELRGKTARIYNYYPVIRQITEHVAAWLEQRG